MKKFVIGLLLGKLIAGTVCYHYYEHYRKEQIQAISAELSEQALRAEAHFDRLYRGLAFSRRFGCDEHVLGVMEDASKDYVAERRLLYQKLEERLDELEQGSLKQKVLEYSKRGLDLVADGLGGIGEVAILSN